MTEATFLQQLRLGPEMAFVILRTESPDREVPLYSGPPEGIIIPARHTWYFIQPKSTSLAITCWSGRKQDLGETCPVERFRSNSILSGHQYLVLINFF